MQQAAFGIVFNANRSQVLLVKRRDLPIWVLPGGGIDEGETPEKAAIREVLEETGLLCTSLRHIALYTTQGSLTSNTYLYELEKESGALSLSDETVDIGYFDLDALPEPFFAVHMKWIQDALLNKNEAIIKPLEGVTLKTVLKFALKHPVIFFRYLLMRVKKRCRV
jgi:8-oxo-dGTP pyrophosphatase MutT (NUDIX family)